MKSINGVLVVPVLLLALMPGIRKEMKLRSFEMKVAEVMLPTKYAACSFLQEKEVLRQAQTDIEQLNFGQPPKSITCDKQGNAVVDFDGGLTARYTFLAG